MPQKPQSGARFGGMQTPHGYLFELTGGNPSLDLANTLDERETGNPQERLRTWQDLLDWGRQVGTITAPEAARFRAHAVRDPDAATLALSRVRSLREAVFQVFSAVASHRAVPVPALAHLNETISRISAMRRLERRSGGFQWTWGDAGAADPERIAWPAAWAAGELLTSPDLARVRVCAGAGCTWLFIDASRNGTRRWCDMSVCGNRAKARRYYARARR
jgi:predicted RNA-binding Zn ribbon-like protein